MKPKQSTMTDAKRAEILPLVRVGILNPLNGLTSWTDPAVRTALQSLLAYAQGFGLAVPLAIPTNGLVRVLYAGWKDGSKRVQYAIRCFFTGTPEKLLRIPRLDTVAAAKVARFAQGLTYLAMTGRIRKGFEADCEEMLTMLRERRGGVGSIAWITILTWDEESGDVIPAHRRKFSSLGSVWDGVEHFWSGQKWPVGKGDTHFEISFDS